MTTAVRLENHGDIAVLLIDSPPVNALGHAVRAGLSSGIASAVADPSIRAIVILAEGRTFPAGADISEFGKPPQDPWLPEVCNQIEASPKPVIAGIHGTALGGGLEVALSAHWRVALASAKVGLPEVSLGILPGAGGTQRTPRLIGAAQALALMISGKPVTAAQALAMGLLDQVVDVDLPEATLALARRLIDEGAAPRPTCNRRDGMRDPVAYEAAVAEARARHAADRLPGPRRIIDCVEAALLLPFDQGLAFERAAFSELVASPESAGLRHAFFAERACAKMPEAAVPARVLAHVGVVGGGLMGAGIAYACLKAGYSVTLLDRDRDGLTRGLERIAKLQQGAVDKGRMSEATRDADWGRLAGALETAALGSVDLAIEAVFEDFDVKAEVLRSLDAVMKPGAVIATNTSYLDVNALAQVTSRPQDVVGLHFFSPAHIMRLLEIVVGQDTAPDVVSTGLALGKRLGKVSVRSGVCDGFIGNRVLTAYRTAADFMVEDGASPAQVDAAMRAFGMPVGPFQVSDMAGLQIGWARRKRLADTRDPAKRYVAIADRLCEAGRFGQPNGKGWYLYEGREGREDPEVAAIIQAERDAKGIIARSFSDDDIRARCLAAMANEGARIVEEGIALRPSDVDAVKLFGYGFPRWEGGPMHWADQFGILQLRNAIRSFADQAPDFWQPAAILDDLIKNGRKFGDLNR
ncbi:MAG: 3-hydroxyacyl-CoA dehydrogenase NAD-binding domain-containing protein [Gemmobacter sp.]|nr:3-hydroxyacyl-CoA dehydrogenase NAD-binding domain-containing protein [Gemmobacter sp.]